MKPQRTFRSFPRIALFWPPAVSRFGQRYTEVANSFVGRSNPLHHLEISHGKNPA